MLYPGVNTVDADHVTGVASNLRGGENPLYTVGDFLSFYPQFGAPEGSVEVIVPQVVVDMYIGLANESVKSSRFRGAWKVCMGLFVAHFCTLWLQSMASPSSGKDVVANAGSVAGVMVSESVDGVSYSMDISSIMQDLNGFAAWKTTTFGVQLATFSKMYGMGGMVVP